MDERTRTGTLRDVSCQSLKWSFDLSEEKQIDLQRVLRNVPYPVEHLRDPSRFIDWESYASYISNFSKYITDEDLIEAARHSWQDPDMRAHRIIGRLLFSLKDQFLAAFGPLGILSKQFPCELSVFEIFPGQLKITVEMKRGCSPCHTFHVLLIGQIIGLPESLGYPRADVEMEPTPNGAVYDVKFQTRSGILAPVRKALTWPFVARDAARELTITYGSLLEKYRELHRETAKLREAERQLEESEAKYRLLTTKVNDVIWTIGPDLKFKHLTPSITSLCGFTEEQVKDMDLSDLLAAESYTRLAGMVEGLLEGENIEDAEIQELQIIHRDGHGIWVEIKSGVIDESDANPRQVISVVRDISERKAIELELQERQESYRVITTSAQDAIVTIDDKYRIALVNPATTRLFGYRSSDLIGEPLMKILPDVTEACLADSKPAETGISLTGVHKDRTRIPLEISFAEHNLRGKKHFTGIIRDVTFRTKVEHERKQLEQQLMASQKMESIGQLTGGIAHDFNNLLVAIMGYAELGLKRNTGGETLNGYLREISQAGRRAADMTQKLLAFSRRQIIEPSVVNVNDLIHGIDLMIKRLLPENIEVRLTFTDENLNVMADKGQLEQVLVNLAVNARDAMPHGGRLHISAGRVMADDGFLNTDQARAKTDYVLIRVSDTGFGMADDVQKKMFEPFFTTKPEGSGTGLGLAVVFGIIKQHGGFIDVQSEMAQGSSIKIYIPATSARLKPSHAGAGDSILPIKGGNETLLIVEDNQQVRELAHLILKGAGYNVIVAANGRQALEAFETHREEVDLVILDVVMPRMGGREVMTRMRKVRPDIKVMFTSGYSDSGMHANFILEGNLELVKKPYTTEGLRAAVRRVLDQPRGDRLKSAG